MNDLRLLFARNVGNYGANRIAPADILQQLRQANSPAVEFIAAHHRASGNFLARVDGSMLDAEVEAVAETATGLRFASRRIRDVEAALRAAHAVADFDSEHFEVRKGSTRRKVAITFDRGAASTPATPLRSKNQRVQIVDSNASSRTIVSIYDRPTKGGDFGVPNAAVEAALREAGIEAAEATIRSARVVKEVLAWAADRGRERWRTLGGGTHA